MNRDLVKEIMKKQGLTQKDIAAKDVWDCALPTVSQKLSGVRPVFLDEANALGKKLNLSEKQYYQVFFA